MSWLRHEDCSNESTALTAHMPDCKRRKCVHIRILLFELLLRCFLAVGIAGHTLRSPPEQGMYLYELAAEAVPAPVAAASSAEVQQQQKQAAPLRPAFVPAHANNGHVSNMLLSLRKR